MSLTTHLAALSNLFGPDMLIVLLIVLLLFGSSKIPQLMRGLGSGVNEFKKGLAEGSAEEKKPPDAAAAGTKPDEKPVDTPKP
jgi:sec-independent protein translocase protein TatA